MVSAPYNFHLDIAKSLPINLRFGTSTWTYPGWKGLIYHDNYKSEKVFRADCLKEYSHFPLFRTVGIDSFFYSPPKPEKLQHYASLVPPDFLWVSKVWERVTIPKFPQHPRYGNYAGSENPDFLNPDVFCREFLPPFEETDIRCHTGPFVFQFPTIAKGVMSASTFFERLDKFLAALPEDQRYAIEIRNPEYLGSDYFEVLNRHRVSHCFNHWNYMPALKSQMKHAAAAGGLQADFFVARILTPHGMNYQQAVKRFEPYTALKEPLPDMRADVVRLAKRALEKNRDAFIIVNNRAEGNAPMTIDALGQMIVTELL